MSRRPWYVRASVAAAAAILAAACGGGERTAPTSAAPAPLAPTAASPAAAVPAAPAAAGRWVGVVLAAQSVEVAAESTGRLQRVVIAVGDRVERGQLLAVVDTSVLQPEVLRAEAVLREAQAALVQSQALAEQAQLRYERRSGTPEIFSKEDLENALLEARSTRTAQDAARARVEQEQASLDRLRRSLAQADIRAPFAGTVALLHLTAGATVAPGTPVLRLVTPGELSIRFAVPPAELGRVRLGQTVEVTNGDGAAWPAVVSRVAPEIDVPSQRVFVEARLLRAGPELKAGLGVRVGPAAGA